jgi:antitoxin (DNA-binding transcriptional repressor) of toxin-antitoxin stability system
MNILKETQGFLDIFFILGNPLGIGTNHPTLPTNPAGEHRERSGMREVIGLGQLRSNACTYLERVAAEETLDVLRRGKLVARIVSIGDWRVAPIPARSVKVVASDAGAWVGLDELRTRAGHRVAAGETIYVVRGGKLLARIVSAGDSRTTPIPADAGRRIELDELRKRAGRYFDRVAAGQTIEVIHGGKLVARIVSPAGNDARRSQLLALHPAP